MSDGQAVERQMRMAAAARRLGQEPWSRVPDEISDLIRPALAQGTEEMIEEILLAVPEYARPQNQEYMRLVRLAVERAVQQFGDLLGDPDAPWESVIAVYREVGAAEAREGRSLDSLHSAMRLGARVAWQRVSAESERLALPGGAVSTMADVLLAFLDEIAAAAGDGYNRAREKVAGEWQYRRRRLLELLLAEPPASMQAITDLAELAQWRLPRTIAAVALYDRGSGGPDAPWALPLPPDALADLTSAAPCVLLPDPDGPGRPQLLEAAVRGWGAAVGPTVAIGETATSLRWARAAAQLSRRGLLPADRLVRAVDHLPELLVFTNEELVQIVAERRLAALAGVRPTYRDSLTRTLLAYIQNNFNATETAARLHVHPQTVRYRINQLQDMFGDQLQDPDLRLELELVLQLWVSRNGDLHPVAPDS